MGVFGSFWDTGHAAGPIAFGFLLAGFGYQRLWPIMAAVMADGLAIFLAGTRRSSAAGAVS